MRLNNREFKIHALEDPSLQNESFICRTIKPRGTMDAVLKVISKHGHLDNLLYSLQFSASNIQEYIY